MKSVLVVGMTAAALLTGCSVFGSGADWKVTGSPDSLELGIETTCEQLVESVEVEETPETVEITVLFAEGEAEDSAEENCIDIESVTLEDRLGDRKAIDGETGDEVKVKDPNI